MTADQPGSLAAALAALQADLPEVKKSETATVRSDKGSYTYTYANLTDITDQLMPRLAAVGLSFIAKPSLHEGQFVLAYSLLHISGQREDGQYPLPNGTPQQLGSAITYGRRYCLCAVTGIAPDDDDDGAAASAQPKKRPAKKPVDGEAQRPSQAKLAAMFARMAELGITKREDALAFVSDKSGHTVESRSELTDEDVSKVLAATDVNPGFGEQS